MQEAGSEIGSEVSAESARAKKLPWVWAIQGISPFIARQFSYGPNCSLKGKVKLYVAKGEHHQKKNFWSYRNSHWGSRD